MLSLRDALVVNAHLKSSEEDPFPDTDALEPDNYRFPIAANFEGTHVVCVVRVMCLGFGVIGLGYGVWGIRFWGFEV